MSIQSVNQRRPMAPFFMFLIMITIVISASAFFWGFLPLMRPEATLRLLDALSLLANPSLPIPLDPTNPARHMEVADTISTGSLLVIIGGASLLTNLACIISFRR